MKLPTTLLLTYQAEYETTPDFTIANLCEKYDVTTKQLSGYTKWSKRSEPSVEPEANIVPAIARNLPIPSNTEELLDDVENFKRLAVAHAVKFMKNDAEFAEVKEFKDMVSIVDSIEKSYKGIADTGPTVNILIQNLTEKFHDDC